MTQSPDSAQRVAASLAGVRDAVSHLIDGAAQQTDSADEAHTGPANRTTMETVAALARAIDARDKYTSGHSTRVAWLARRFGVALRLSPARLQWLEWAGLLHDVGKLGVPERILHKPGELTPDEFTVVRRHPRLGYEMLKPVTSLRPILDAVLHHHENHDGSGYPLGLVGTSTPLLARIVHIVDIFDALTSSRSYRAAHDVDAALRIMSEQAGTVTDPRLTRVFVRVVRREMRRDEAAFSVRFGNALPARHTFALAEEALCTSAA